MCNIFYIHLIYCFVDAQMSWLTGEKRIFRISQKITKIWQIWHLYSRSQVDIATNAHLGITPSVSHSFWCTLYIRCQIRQHEMVDY